MQKLIFSLTFSFILGHCFSQNPVINTDTSLSLKQPILPEQNKQQQLTSNPELSIFPNPAKNKVTLQVKGFEPGTALVKILDTKGKMIREDSRLLTNGTEDIVMFLMIPPGIYFIIVSEKGKVSRKKLVML
ncbi:MAG: T9SS type A sorting domain-containing protein [Ferruginibacter sp.]